MGLPGVNITGRRVDTGLGKLVIGLMGPRGLYTLGVLDADDLANSSIVNFVRVEGEGVARVDVEETSLVSDKVSMASTSSSWCLYFWRLLQNHTLTSSGSRSSSLPIISIIWRLGRGSLAKYSSRVLRV